MRDMFVVVVLIATLVSQGTAQLTFGPVFHLSQYGATEGGTLVVRLSARILTIPQVPPFNGSIEVDITAEDLPSGDPRQSALFGPGRTDVVNTIQDFPFTSGSKSVFKNFTIVDDDVLEFDELFIAEFSFSPEILYSWNVRLDEPSTAFILIRDDDFVEVNFDQDSYTVAESNGQVSVSLRIDGKFFYPVWAIIEVSSGTAMDPEDFSSANRYNVTFLQSVFTDGGDPAPSTLSSPIIISLVNDDIFEDVEFFQARIVVTSDRLRVRIGPQDAIKVFITDDDYPLCTFQRCTTNRAALCTVVGADGNCTNQLTSCTACYFAREERPLPNKCSTNLRNYSCAGLTGSDLKECLQTWEKCVNKAFKDVHGKTPRRLRKKRFFKCPEFPCN